MNSEDVEANLKMIETRLDELEEQMDQNNESIHQILGGGPSRLPSTLIEQFADWKVLEFKYKSFVGDLTAKFPWQMTIENKCDIDLTLQPTLLVVDQESFIVEKVHDERIFAPAGKVSFHRGLAVQYSWQYEEAFTVELSLCVLSDC